MRYRNLVLIVVLVLVVLGCKPRAKPPAVEGKEDKFTRARVRMVEEQIKARGVKDEKVLGALLKVRRHKFVLSEYLEYAYADSPLPIGEGQTISQPYIVALMTECLKLKGNEKVLEVGTGSGYQAAVLAEIVKEVYTIEILPELAKRAGQTLKDLGYKNIKVKIGDGYLGWAEYAPFDAIIVTCAPDHIPPPLVKQLKEGGRMIIPVGDVYGGQELVLVEKLKGEVRQRVVIPVRFVPMLGEEVKKK